MAKTKKTKQSKIFDELYFWIPPGASVKKMLSLFHVKLSIAIFTDILHTRKITLILLTNYPKFSGKYLCCLQMCYLSSKYLVVFGGKLHYFIIVQAFFDQVTTTKENWVNWINNKLLLCIAPPPPTPKHTYNARWNQNSGNMCKLIGPTPWKYVTVDCRPQRAA